MKRCYKCGKEWNGGKERPGPKEFCDGCSAYLHCCLNCRFYDEGAHNKCYIPNTEYIADKTGGNFCDEFEFGDDETDNRPGRRGVFLSDGKKKTDAHDAFNKLFGDNQDEVDVGSSDFEQLFGD